MGQRVGSFLRKSRYKMKMEYKDHGKIPLSKYFQEFAEGEAVGLKIQSNVIYGRFFPRFQGLMGRITGKRGDCYGVTFKDGGKEKKVFVHPIHLVKQEAKK